MKQGGAPADIDRFLLKLKAGTVIFEEGAPGDEMFVVQSGTVEITKKRKGVEKSLAKLEKGDFFGEMSILENVPRTAKASAVTDVELVRIDQSTFDEMLRNNGEIAVRMLRKLCLRLRETTQLLEQSTGIPRSVEESSDIFSKVGARHDIFRLVPEAGGADFFLNEEGDTTVGRVDPVTGLRPDVDLTALDTQRSVSRRHAKIVRLGSEFEVVEDIGTMNGTFVNGRRIATGNPIRLRDGDKVRFGLVDLTFRVTQE
jgi:CRP-like cAMP-binding protein